MRTTSTAATATGPHRRTLSAVLATAGAAVLAVLGVQPPAAAAPAVTTTAPAAASTSAAGPAAPAGAGSTHPLLEPACPTPAKGSFTCFALRRADLAPVKGLRPAAVPPTGWGAGDLQSAYGLPADGGSGRTVAIVDAYDDPNAEADLAVYRAQYGLAACTTANGCFRKADQRGGTAYPAPDPGWAGEISLDLDMVSAVAPNARILLVEADDSANDDLGASVDEAVALGAQYVSNSYGTDYRGGSGEDPAETTVLDAHYNHPGVAITASTGDFGYGVSYPAASRYVTSVGGTTLTRDPSTARGWTEAAWEDAGSGCSRFEPKPAFQTDTGCADRSLADVSAVALGVAVYQTYGNGGWAVYGGTSVSAPVIAGVYADAGTPAPGTYPNSYPYAVASALNDVTSGANGSCSPTYLCTGAPGYDGPTGLGTPDGLAAFRTGPHGVLAGTVTDQATGAALAGATVGSGADVAHTDAAGHYALALTTGSHDVTAEAFGHTAATASGVAIGDGTTVRRDFALGALPSAAVSGKVLDGSGHGWPLYAKITVDGDPGAAWTDPATGAYTLDLPQGHTFTLHVAAATSGYRAVTRTVAVGRTARTLDLPVPADPWAALPPGYRLDTPGTTEPFDATAAPPQGWSVVNAPGTNGGWEFDDPGNRGNHTGGTGAFAIADSDHFGAGGGQDSQLVSPSYDFTGKTDPEVAFATDYRAFPGQKGTVDASADNGATWTTLWSTDTTVDGPTRIDLPLTAFAGKPAVRLRFHFTAAFGWYWAVDDVFVGTRDLVPTPGALIVGTVADANTRTGVVGATVTDTAAPGTTTTTVATPEDPNLGDGYYTLFTPAFGRHTVTAAKSRYVTQSRTVNVGADTAVRAAFTLKAGRIGITPGSVSATVAWGKAATRNLTVRNTGTAPATVTLGERPGGFTLLGKGAPARRVAGHFSPLSSLSRPSGPSGPASGPARPPAALPAASGDAWQTAPDYPHAVMDNAADTLDGKVYSAFGFDGTADSRDMYVLDPTAGTWTRLAPAADTREDPAHGVIDGRFYAAGGWGPDGRPDPKLEIYDPALDVWSTGAPAPAPHAGAGTAVLDGRLYMVGGCAATSCGSTDASAYDAATDTWSTIAAYPEPISWQACGPVNGLLYCAGGFGAGNTEVSHAYAYDPGTDRWSRVADMPTPQWGAHYTAANGLLLLAGGISRNALTNATQAFDPATGTWSALPNADTASYRGGGAPGFYTVGGGTAPGQPLPAVALLPGFDQQGAADVNWLSESATQLTLQPGAGATVTVTLDASVPGVVQPGDFAARLVAATDTPYAVPAAAVTLHVQPPRTWGKITGTVRGTTAAGGSAPLGGATVQIDSWAASYTLTTAADGTYALWLDVRNNPLTVIVAKDGYQPTVTTVRIRKGATVTSDVTLKRT